MMSRRGFPKSTTPTTVQSLGRSPISIRPANKPQDDYNSKLCIQVMIDDMMVRPHNNMKKQVMNDDRKVKPHYNTNHNLKNNSIHDYVWAEADYFKPITIQKQN